MIRECTAADIAVMYDIMNDAAQAYKGVIENDCWHEPYMPMEYLKSEVEDGVRFWGYEEAGELVGVMGLQDKGDVTLIRHAYVKTARRNKGIGSQLLQYLESMISGRALVGTWLAATWAISFYEKNGYVQLSAEVSDRLLRKYWNIGARHRETSLVLERVL